MPAIAGVVPFRRVAASPRRQMQTMNSAFRAVLSPCIGVCMLDDEGLCMGCYRSSGEIARWLQMGDDERLHLMETVLPQREARRRT